MTVALFLGGARSGKSRLAQAAAEAHPGPLTFIATAQALDDEMRARIARHQADRGPCWRTVEAPLALPEAIGAAEGVVLVDCLTLWLTNLMLGEHDVATASARLIEALRAASAPVILVSNEVGQGIVPETPLGRAFRDAAGRLNQAVAAVASEVTLAVAGLPLRVK